MKFDCTTLGGFRVACSPKAQILDQLQATLQSKTPFWLIPLNLEGIVRAKQDPNYWSLVSKADLFTADGVPLLWWSKLTQKHIVERCCGVDLVSSLLKRSLGQRIAILGTHDERQTRDFLSGLGHQQENLLVWTKDYVDSAEINQALLDQTTLHKSSLIIVALGVPKQDHLCHYLRSRNLPALMIGVGGAMDFLMGNTRRAPEWVQRMGLEWLHRLLQNPRKLWHRYLVRYPTGLLLLSQSAIATLLRKAGNKLQGKTSKH